MNRIEFAERLIIPTLRYPQSKRRSKIEMDMTSMVDVTFLLLIFFMVTASFIVQSAFQTPSNSEGSSMIESEQVAKIEVRVTPTGEFEVAYASQEIQSFNSKHELRREVTGILTTNSGRLCAVLLPDSKSEHQNVIQAVDVLTGIEIPFSIRLAH